MVQNSSIFIQITPSNSIDKMKKGHNLDLKARIFVKLCLFVCLFVSPLSVMVLCPRYRSRKSSTLLEVTLFLADHQPINVINQHQPMYLFKVHSAFSLTHLGMSVQFCQPAQVFFSFFL